MVLPVTSPGLENGAVLIRGGKIQKIGRWPDLSHENAQETVDLDEAILLPGLVNAHCHLDYTHMAGLFGRPKQFSDWLMLITTTKSEWDLADYRASWAAGAEMLARTGTTTVADIEAVPELLPRMWHKTPLRVCSFLEMIGLTGRRSARAILDETLQKIRSLPRSRGIGLSPHAPYSTLPELLKLSAEAAGQYNLRLAVHVGESATELEMFNRGRGDMFRWLERSGRDMSDCGNCSPVKHLDRCGVLNERLLAIHANYLARRDAALLGKRRVNVVHCPRSHLFFGHEPFQRKRLARAGANICIGTDSLATALKHPRQRIQLNMFEEMRCLAGREPALSPRSILLMGTRNGARALGMQGKLGELSAGAFADLIAVPFRGELRAIDGAVLQHDGNVRASMIAGRWAVKPG
jgi:cytosine/adenosine deaminase-related metal-dependent hydrolase